MIFVPTKNKRNVLVSVQTSGDCRIVRIAALFCDHERISHDVFNDADEARLLLAFWRAINAGDRIFSAGVTRVFETVRLRTWHLDLLPSLEIDLRRVYDVELHDTSHLGERA